MHDQKEITAVITHNLTVISFKS